MILYFILQYLLRQAFAEFAHVYVIYMHVLFIIDARPLLCAGTICHALISCFKWAAMQ